MKVLILGGTGAMGKHLTELLAQQHFNIFVTTRRTRKNLKNIRYIVGDAHNNIFLDQLLTEHWDVIVDFMLYTTIEFSNRMHKLLDSTMQYIFLSSSRVYADAVKITEDSQRLLDNCEDKEYLQTDEYGLAKARQEDLLINSSKNNWTIIRPYITYSETRLQLGVLEKEYWLYRALKGRTIVFSEDIASRLTTLTYGFDVATGIRSLLGKKQTYGQIFNITSDQSLKWQQVYDVYEELLVDHLGYKPKIKYCDKLSFNRCHSGKYQIMYDRLFNRSFDNKKILDYINVSEFTAPKEGLKKCLSEFLRNPQFGEIDWGLEAKKDKITHEYTPLSEINTLKQKMKYIIYRFIQVL